MTDRVTREACKGDDAERYIVLVDHAKGKKIVANEIAVARDDERTGNYDVQYRLAFDCGDDLAALDIAQQMIKNSRGNDHDRNADPASGNAANKLLRKGTRCCDGD